jgi:platelet-activating factor acetylhydrolase IB subunit alpha
MRSIEYALVVDVVSQLPLMYCFVCTQAWDHESGDYIRTLKGHTNTVNSLSFTPTGSHLASCSTDLSIKLWDFSTYACLRTLRGHDHTISAIRFLPDPALFQDQQQRQQGKATAGTTGLDPQQMACKFLLSASRDHTVKVWDLESGFCEHTVQHHTDWVRCLAVRSSDGARWASAGNDTVIYVYNNARQKLWDLRGHEQVVESLAFVTEECMSSSSSTSTTQRPNKHTETIRDYLASGSRDRTVRLWRIADGTSLAVWAVHDNWVRSVLIHPNGNYVISSADDKSIRVFDIKANRCLRTLENAHHHFVTSLDMHPSLAVMVSGSVDQTVRCWNLD